MSIDYLEGPSTEAAETRPAADAPVETRAPEPPPSPPTRKRRLWRWAAMIAAAVIGLLVLLVAGARLAVRIEPGRAFAVRMLDGLPLGPLGRLRIEGVKGDLLGAFSVAQLSIVDPQGAWLEASDLSVRWSPDALIARRFHAERIDAASLRILRRPVLTPQPAARGGGELPVSIHIDALHLTLETLPAFSVQRGLWDVSGRLAIARRGAAHGRIDASSRLHAGDGLHAVFRLGEAHQVRLQAQAVEGDGGALAGALGLPADRRLVVQADAEGTTDAGDLSLKATSGAATPIAVRAAWSKAGATMDADFSLTASRLTGELAARAGPDAQVRLTARHTGGDLYDIGGGVATRDATLTIDGPLDWRARRTPGLKVRLKLADLSRWQGAVKAGPTTVAGVFVGDIFRFQLKGAVQSQGLAEGGYALARAGGPATLARANDEWRLQADIVGAGGAGQGLAPALLGASPHVALDGSLLADRRVLIRRLDVQGAGLKVQATGAAGLLGGLSFKGQAQLSNLAAAYPGARGLVSASWSAAEPKGARAWSFGFDGRASGFASGIGDLDHLLGAAPSLKAEADWGPDGLSVANAALSGTALQANLKGRLDPRGAMGGAMGFDVDWSAKGPFEAGPVEFAGAAQGTGKLTGQIEAPQVDLAAELASVDLGPLRLAPVHLDLRLAKDATGLGGQVALNGASRYGPAVAKAGFRVQGAGVDLSGVSIDAGGVRASGALALNNGAPSTADLTLDVRTGAVLSSGQLGGHVVLAQKPAGLVADIALDGRDVAAPGAPGTVHALRLRAAGPWRKLPFQLSADGAAPTPWRFAGEGVADQGGDTREIELSGQGRVRAADLRTLEPAVLVLKGDERDLRAKLALGGGRAEVQARQTGDALDAAAEVSGVALSTFDRDFVGTVAGRLTLNGRGAALGGALDATLAGARSRDAPANLALDGQVHAALAGDRLRLTAEATNAQGLKSALDVTLPAVASAAPLNLAIDRTRPIQGAFSADGEIRPLWDLLVGGAQTVSGRVDAKATLAGTLADPRATGSATLANGRFTDTGSGLQLQNIALSADFGQDAVRVRQASGADGQGGLMSGSGVVSLQRDGGSTFALKLTKFRLFDNDLGRASVSGDLNVNRDAKGAAKLTGALKVDRADISPDTPAPTGIVSLDVVEINRAPRPGEEEAAPVRTSAGPPVALDVSIRAPRGVFVRGKGLNVELSLDAHVGGTVARPDLTGTANVVLGSYDFAGKRFDFDQRGVVRLASDPADIRLDLSATLEQPTLTAVVKVTGTASKPDITLSSTPVLPQDEVLSQVLFGASASQLAPAQAAELASALASLSRGGGFDLLGRLRQFAGLDRLALGAGVSGTGVAGGKYINDNVYVELIGGGREGPTASVEWRVRKNFSIVSQVGTQGDELSVQFRKNY